MQDPNVVMIGAGAMGGVIAGALADAGARLSIIDTDAEHVAAINADGLRVAALGAEGARPVAATTEANVEGEADLVVVMTPAYETAKAAQTAARVLGPDGAAVSVQNGLGNAEALIAALGPERVFMGSTRTSADRPEPGCPRATKIGPTTVGELDGPSRLRTEWFADALNRGGLPTVVSENVVGVLWSKFIHNCAINPLSAITGLRMGEVARSEELSDLQSQVVEEGLAVAAAKGITLEYPNPLPQMKRHVWQKFTKPSMMQHVENGRMIEIDAINGWLVREAEALGMDAPANRILTSLARARALAMQRQLHEKLDYVALTREAEAEIARGDTPWED